MKLLFQLLPLVLLASCATNPPDQKVSNEGIVSNVIAPQTLQIMGETYNARFSASDTTKIIVEYYRAGETPKNWSRLLALRLATTGGNSLDQAKSVEQQMRERGSKAVRVYKDPNAAGYGVEFILPAAGYEELDVFRFIDRTDGVGTISLQYAEVIFNPERHTMSESNLSKTCVTID